jgi:hypothetical protein
MKRGDAQKSSMATTVQGKARLRMNRDATGKKPEKPGAQLRTAR